MKGGMNFLLFETVFLFLFYETVVLILLQLVQVLKQFVREVGEKSQQGALQVPPYTFSSPIPSSQMHTRLLYHSLRYFHSAKCLQVLVACDALRDDVLPPLGIRLEDQQVPCLPSRVPVSWQHSNDLT